MTREKVIVEATRLWVGTKWVHQASIKGVGCDCIGLIRGVYKDITGLVFDDVMNYAQTPFFYCRDDQLYPQLKKYFTEIPVSESKPGDILTFSFRENFPDHHLGIILDDGFFVHASCDPGMKKVIATRYDDQWKERTRHAFRFPGVE